MANKDLFEQAIADAKKLKEISMANARQVMEESFAPKLQEMFRLKLSEMDSLEEEENLEEEALEEGTYEESMDNEGMIQEDDINEATLEEILAELELEEGIEEPLEEAKKSEDDSEEEKDDTEEEDDSEEEMPEESAAGDEKVTKLTVDMLTDLIRDAVAEAMGSQEGAPDEEGDLESADEVPGGGVADEESINIGETISLDEILAELEEAQEPTLEEEQIEEAQDEHKGKLEEAVKTISYLKSQLSEINLLNAKLLYVNKIFKSKSLTESQKVSVVTAFDRAATTKEAKNIYETLVDSLTPAQTPKKAAIKESLGFASKPIGSAPAKPIVEADAYVYRMQQLAGIKKPNI
jgi:hypothetical protein